MNTIHDVAAYILARRGPMTTMKLQKLCFYAQAWSLAWDEVPIFDTDFRAWANGPVAKELFELHRGEFTVAKWPYGNVASITGDAQETVDAVLRDYGPMSGHDLSRLTHRERPWRTAREGLAPGDRSDKVISKESMQAYYSGLIAADESEVVSPRGSDVF